MQKQLYLIILLFLNLIYVQGQEVTFKASAPSAVAKGDQFRLVYVLENAQGRDVKAPSSIEGFEILYGPAVSTNQSAFIANGKADVRITESYIYTLTATAEGNHHIPAATINVDGKILKSNTLQIKVLPPDKTRQNDQTKPQDRGQQPSASTSTSANITSSDAFIRVIPSKTKIREQEAFVVTFRFYTTLDVIDIGKIEFPEFDGFMVEDQDLPPARQLQMEHYNGRNYNVINLRRTLLFPQRSGKITIPSGKIEMIFRVKTGQTYPTIFGPQPVYSEVKKALTTAPLSINVSELPAGKPANFSNGVGTFSMKHSISETSVKANDPITLTLTISGTGNMKLLKNPELVLPKDFESYDPKITNDFRFTDNGLTGTRTIEYLFIPRYQGTYKIPPVQFSFFDTQSNSFKTLSTPEYTIEVARDPNAGNHTATSFTQTDVQVEQDIRHIKTGKPSFISMSNFLVGSTAYYLWYAVPLLIFLIVFILYRKQIKENADIIGMRTKQANKVAVKRLKQAKKHLQAHEKEKFYEEVLRATWGYLSDKLIIPVANLNRDNVELEMSNYGAGKELTDKFIYILDTCEFARYAPAESNTAMDELYATTVDAIGEMENSKRKMKTSK